jgi:hypothetical protein
MGELDFIDEDGTPIVILCYVKVQSIKGHTNFVLIGNDTLADIQADINYHSNMSLWRYRQKISSQSCYNHRGTKQFHRQQHIVIC